MIDLHSHILPKMDDGSRSVEESISLLETAYSKGVEAVFSTPHFYPKREDPESFLRRRAHCAERLFESGADVLSRLPVYLGSEVAYFYGMSRYESLRELSLGGSDFILVEMPFDKWNPEDVDEILDIRRCRGLTPVIAHMERYLTFGNKKYIKFFRANGILIQSNAEFFLSKKTGSKALRYLKKGYISVLGSDCHNVESRPENYSDAVDIIKASKKCGDFSRIEENERSILSGAMPYGTFGNA